LGERELEDGADWVLRRFVGRLEVAGQAHVPRDGPLIIAANHPGFCDAVALLAAAGRPDLRVVAAGSRYLRSLYGSSRYLLYVPEYGAGRHVAVRAVAGHLRHGGAVLLFPAGQIEPDPALHPGAAESLDGWSPSVSVLARMAGGTRVVPALVSGVLSAPAQQHPLTRLRRPGQRLGLARLLQMLVPAYRAVTVRVAFGAPLMDADLWDSSRDQRVATGVVADRVRRLMDRPPTDWTTLLRG
jgi:1-acyl-sn-glycerol-3-phosphate acyltransferase